VEDDAAWVLTAVGLFVLLLSVLAGVRAGDEAAQRGKGAENERARVEAVVLHGAPGHDQESDTDADACAGRLCGTPTGRAQSTKSTSR